MKPSKILVLIALVSSLALGPGWAATQPAPEFAPSGAWFNAKPVTLAQLRGKVVLVNVWTIECSNCTRSMPTLKSWYAKYRASGLEIIGVHTPETKWQKPAGLVQNWIKREGITWPVFQDNLNATWNAYSSSAWPTFYLIDRHGHIRTTEAGELSSQYPDGIAPFEAQIKTLLTEKP